jgi:mRNA interferase MazF
MTNLKRGDIVLADLGYVAKVRPCVVVSIPHVDSRRNMSVIAPLTTQPRGGECEVPFPKPPWMNEQAVINLIGILGIDNAKILRFLGRMQAPTMDKVDDGLARMLGL